MSTFFLHSPFHSAYENVALEHYLVHHRTENILLVYVNSPAVVIGKHQNAFAEANHKYLQLHQIPLARRISGGGAVYHDEGNVNVSLIHQARFVDMQSILRPLQAFIETLGLVAQITPTNDILVNEKKVTGTAGHVFKQRSLQHATLLIDARLEHLRESLRVEREKFIGHHVASRPSPVTNLLSELHQRFTFENVQSQLISFLKKWFLAQESLILSEFEIQQIKHIAKEKFSSWEWNYAYSPPFVYSETLDATNSTIQCSVKDGIIERLECHPPIIDFDLESLIGLRFQAPLSNIIK